MTRTLGDFVKERREDAGLNQSELARSSGVLRETINRIENNKTMLPSADSRRRLAHALGVTHLDLLIAAGEILPEEVRAAGSEGVVARDPSRLRDRLHAAVDAVNWDRAEHMATTLLEIMAAQRYDQETGKPEVRMPQRAPETVQSR